MGGEQKDKQRCVYVIKCEDGSLYKGYTQDIESRFLEHINGTGAKHTKKYKPLEIVYQEKCETKEIAIKREKYLKSGSGRKWLNSILKNIPEIQLSDKDRHCEE